MSWELVFHPDVEDEIRESYQWYENRQMGLGDDFLAAGGGIHGAPSNA